MTIKQLLLDLEYGKDLADSILSGDKNGDNHGNGVNVISDGDRDNASTSDGGNIEDNALC